MKSIDKETLKVCGKRMMFDLNEEEISSLEEMITRFANQIKEADKIQGVVETTPMTFPFECKTTFLREDVANGGVERDELFSNTKDMVDGQIRLPKVVG